MAKRKVSRFNNLFFSRVKYEKAWEALDKVEADPRSSLNDIACAKINVLQIGHELNILGYELSNTYKLHN